MLTSYISLKCQCSQCIQHSLDWFHRYYHIEVLMKYSTMLEPSQQFTQIHQILFFKFTANFPQIWPIVSVFHRSQCLVTQGQRHAQPTFIGHQEQWCLSRQTGLQCQVEDAKWNGNMKAKIADSRGGVHENAADGEKMIAQQKEKRQSWEGVRERRKSREESSAKGCKSPDICTGKEAGVWKAALNTSCIYIPVYPSL